MARTSNAAAVAAVAAIAATATSATAVPSTHPKRVRKRRVRQESVRSRSAGVLRAYHVVRCGWVFVCPTKSATEQCGMAFLGVCVRSVPMRRRNWRGDRVRNETRVRITVVLVCTPVLETLRTRSHGRVLGVPPDGRRGLAGMHCL